MVVIWRLVLSKLDCIYDKFDDKFWRESQLIQIDETAIIKISATKLYLVNVVSVNEEICL